MQHSLRNCLQSPLHWRLRQKGQNWQTPPRPRERHLGNIVIKRIQSPLLPGRRKENTRFWMSNWHRHYFFRQILTSTIGQKNYLRKFRLHNPTEQEINPPSPPHLKRQQIRLPWQPNLTCSINAQWKNTHQQYNLTSARRCQIHVHWHQNILPWHSNEVLPINVHTSKFYPSRDPRQIRGENRIWRQRICASRDPTRHVQPQRSRSRILWPTSPKTCYIWIKTNATHRRPLVPQDKTG